MVNGLLFLLLGLFLPLAHGQDNPALVPANYTDFSGGLVDSIDPAKLQPNQSPNLQNAVIDDPAGSLKPRNGFNQCGTLPSGNIATNLYNYSKTDGTQRLIVTDDSAVYQTADCVTYTTVKFGLGGQNKVSFATARNKLWMVNGSSHAFVWDGVAISTMDGRANTPNPAPPKARYIEFWKERVWLARTADNPSLVQFSDVADPNGTDVDPSTGTAAFPAGNAFYVDQDGGCPIYGIRAYRNRLFVFKDRCGIFEIIFNTNFDNAVIKTAASVGSRFNSFAELDGILYFVGPDGIYAFDGTTAARISDGIAQKFSTITQPLVNNLYKIWTSQNDFTAGTTSRSTVSAVPGSVVISSNPASVQNGQFETGSLSPHICHKTGTGADCQIVNPGPMFGTAEVEVVLNTGSGGSAGVHVFDVNGTTRTSLIGSNAVTTTPSTYTINTDAFAGVSVFLHFFAIDGSTESHLYIASFTANGNITYQAYGRGAGSSVGFDAIDNIQTYTYFSTATFFSDEFNAVSVSSWSTFDVTATENGGQLLYQIRVGTDSSTRSHAAWSAITPGSYITAVTSQTYIQWMSSMTAPTSLGNTPRIDDVTIGYIQGGSPQQGLYIESWKNRLWISASSGTVTSTTTAQNNIVLTKTRAPLNSWVPHDLKIGPMVKWSDRFYAAASTHSAIYRMDYGTSDNGAPIVWFWESRDEAWGLPNTRKDLLDITASFRYGNAANASLAWSRDSGVTYSTTNVSLPMNGSGYGSRRLNVNGGNSLTYRFRVLDSTVDESATILGITGWAVPWKKRE